MVHKPETTFAALIESRMKALEINQVELERRSGITDTTWAAWRAGSLPRKLYVKLAAPALEMPVDEVQAIVDEDRRSRVGVAIDTKDDTQAWIEFQQPAPAEQGV